MNRKWIRLAVVAAMIVMIMTPSLGVIPRDDAVQSVLPYSKTHGTLSMAGPYSYENHSYYYAEMTTNRTLSGVLIVDGESGEIITDKEIAEKISYTRAYLENVTPENLAAYEAVRETYSVSAAICRQKAELFRNEIPLYKADEREKLGTIVQSHIDAANVYDEMATLFEDVIKTQTDVVSGNASYENAVILANQMKDYEEDLQNLGKAYDKVMADTNTYYDVLINGAVAYNLNATQLKDYKLINDNTMKQEKEIMVTQQLALVKEDNENTKARVERDMQVMDEVLKTNDVPGFGVLLAICAVLITGVLIQKRRK
jgi:hypothetical protein